MAARRKRPAAEGNSGSSSPAQDDEADILAEVGAVRDDETGELVVDEDQIEAAGAVDATTVIKNRRMEEVTNKRRANMKRVSFSTDDILEQYEVAIKTWPPNTLDIHVKRMTGSPIARVITSRPRSGTELYEALRVMHGPSEEAEYEVKFLDINNKQYRGTGRITLPDARSAPAPQQGQQPVVYPPQQYPAPPPGYTQVAPPPAPPAPAPVPTVQGIDPGTMLTLMQQMIGMVDQMRTTAQPAPPPQAPPPPAWQAPPPQMPAPLAPGATPAEMMEWMQKMVAMVDQMRATAQPAAQAPASAPVYQPPPPPAPAPSPMSSMTDTITMMEQMFKLFQRMQPPAPAATAPDRGGPFRGPRPAYGGDPGGYPEPRTYQPPPPPPREKTPDELMREAMGTIRRVTNVVQEMQSMFPQQDHSEASAAEPTDDDSPIRVVDTGAGRLVMDKENGTMRWGETILTALPGMMKWGTEQVEAVRKIQAERRRPPVQKLQEGYVEVGPGYKAPDGYVAVPVDELPPAPEETPPPIDSVQPPQTGRQSWGTGQ